MDEDKKIRRAKNNAYCLLRSRPRSEFEVRNRLKLKGYGDSTIERVIGDLKRTDDLSDEKFARFWVESRMHLNPVGDVVLRRELKEKGVNDSIIEATLSEKSKNYDEYEVAFNMAVERFGHFKKLDRRKAVKRVYDFLVRRGFKYDTVRRIIDELIGGGGEEARE